MEGNLYLSNPVRKDIHGHEHYHTAYIVAARTKQEARTKLISYMTELSCSDRWDVKNKDMKELYAGKHLPLELRIQILSEVLGTGQSGEIIRNGGVIR